MRKKSINSGGHESEEEIAEKQDSGIFQQPRDRQLKNSRGKTATVDEFSRLDESVERMGEGDGKQNSASPSEKTSFAAMVDSLSLEPIESHRVKEGNAENSVPAQVNESLPRRLFASDRYPSQSRVNSYSNPEYLLDIVKILDGTSEYDWLKRSCFGRLLELPINKSSFSGKLVHQFISRSLRTHKKHELWFVFGGYPMRFSLREFALLTGLNCNPYPRKDLGKKIQYTVEEEEDYWHELLGPKQNYEIDEIVDMLKLDKRLPATKRMTGGRRLRLTLIVLVDGILTCNSSHVRASREVVDMLEDLDTFVKYPWGRRSFERTIEVAKVGSKIMSASVLTSKLCQSHFTTHGFTLALQLLILNSIHKLESWLPQANKDATFETRSVNKLKKLRIFHNANIVEAEQHVDLQVVPILLKATRWRTMMSVGLMRPKIFELTTSANESQMGHRLEETSGGGEEMTSPY